MFSVALKSKVWQLGLTSGLFALTYLMSLTSFVSDLEYDLFQYVLALRPSGDAYLQDVNVVFAPHWIVLVVYLLILAVYVRKYTRSRTTAVSFLTITIILFCLLMVELALAAFAQIYLPVLLPGFVMLLVSLIYWIIDVYQRIRASLLTTTETVDLAQINQRIEDGELKSALIMLKHCPYSDELLEVGYELGMLLEANKNWASALNLYHWLSKYDPGLSDFVQRVEEIRQAKREVMTEIREPVDQIGHFDLVKKIAKGATAIVYEAVDRRTQNRVALKVMSNSNQQSGEQSRIEQWLKEAEIVAQLEHRNIVQIYDAAMYGNYACIAMEYVSGYAMALRLRRREYITVGECIRLCRDVLSALSVAHQHGVVHGDIKPANMLYDENKDNYIITDFGAAYARNDSHRQDNTIVGTPSYMSPEQLQGRKLDGRSDLFSLAVSLYHLLSGHQPFVGSDLKDLKKSIISIEPNLDHLTLPQSLKEILVKALQKKTYMRFADAQQMLTAIDYCESQLRSRNR